MAGKSGRVTLRDVARAANVSETTASHVLSGRRHVAEQTKVRVLNAVRELQYRPNQIARALRVQATHTVAFFVQDIGNVSLTASIRGASALLRARGYATLMIDSPESGITLGLVNQSLDRMPSGAVFFGEEPKSDVKELLDSRNVPFAVGGLGQLHEGRFDSVYVDQAAAVRHATRELLRQNPAQICFIGGDADDEGARQRLNGYQQALEDAGRVRTDERIILVPYSFDGGRDAVRSLTGRMPDVIVAGSDQIALGVVAEARELGYSVPDDVRVMGFDNIDVCEIVSPTLSSIDVKFAQQGLMCAELLLRRMDDHGRPFERIEVEPELIFRQSTEPGTPGARAAGPSRS